jgi:NADPH-dependent curcumin reductase CurA
LYLSLDPYMRGQMNAATPNPTEIGATMAGEVVAEILQSTHPAYRPGELVLAMTGWRTHAAIEASGLRRLDPGQTPVTTALGVLGMPGFAAYTGMKLIGQPKEGETVVVAAASGPVGSLVGQLAQLAGARAVGIGEAPRSAPMSATSWALTPSSTAAPGDFRRRWREPARTGSMFTSRA